MRFYIGCLWDAYYKALKISENQPVIFDRYLLSTLAYPYYLCENSYPVEEIMRISAPPEADLNILIKTNTSTAPRRIISRNNKISDSYLDRNIVLQKKVSAYLESKCEITICNDCNSLMETITWCKMEILYFINSYIINKTYAKIQN